MAKNTLSCPKCGAMARVTDVVLNPVDNEKYKRRRCDKCGHISFTIEYEIDADEHFRKQWRTYHRKNKNKE